MTAPVDFALIGPRRTVRAAGLAAAADDGPDRATATAQAMALLRRHEKRTGRPGAVVGAIPFDPAEPARLYVPEEVVVGPSAPPPAAPPPGCEGRPVEPEFPHQRLDDAGYRRSVARVVDAIRAGEVAKVVLARAVDAVAAAPVDVDRLLERLHAGNPRAYAYRVDLGDDGRPSLVGASPELLIRVQDGQVVSNPLAGSRPRCPDAAADEANRAELAASAKDAGEHAHVVSAVAAALAPLTRDLQVPREPSVSATRDLWHLSTTVAGRVAPGVGSLDLAHAIHPTPAVCGVPREGALAAIRVLEPVQRGFFAGLVGWCDSTGDGEWVIALRGGLVDGARVRVHAGAGLVAASEPQLEHEETGMKMRTFLRALREVAGPIEVGVADAEVVRA